MSDFFSMSADKQSARLTELAEQALAQWGVSGCTPKLLKYRENAVFEVRTADGKRAAMRVHRQGYHSHDSLESELKWTAMLAAGGMAVPRPIAADSGAFIVDIETENVPGVWKVDMLAWLDGRMLGAAGERLDYEGRDPEKLFFDVGRLMAQLHNLSTAWPEQNAMRRHAWDGDGLVGDEPLWGRFWELAALTPQQKDLLIRARSVIAEDLVAYGKTADNYGLIHADLTPENVFLSGDVPQLVDFDDAGFGWHMFEIATALFWLAGEPNFDQICKQVLKGYQSLRSLSQRDLDTLDLFSAARSTTYLGWVHTRQNTETAKELAPLMIEIAESLCSAYLAGRS